MALALVLLGLYAVWFPAETHASTPLVLSLGWAALLPFAWRRSTKQEIQLLCFMSGPLFLLLSLQVWRSPDRCQGIEEVFLLVALFALYWTARRFPPSNRMILLFTLGLAGLALWGLYQTGGGLDRLRPMIDQLPEASRAAALARITRARAFASLLLPSHLAVILATALPILVAGIRKGRAGIPAIAGTLLVVAGLAATRSPAGAVLAIGAAGMVLVGRRQEEKQGKGVHILLLLLLFAALLLASFRPDVRRLEPLKIRADNWVSAAWIFSRAPFAGAGLGSFGLAVRQLPFPVANYPLHAHCLPLELMSDIGIGGLAFWIYGMVLLLRLSRGIRRESPGLAAAILVVPLHNLVDFSLFSSAVALPWVLLLAWASARLKQQGPEAATPPPRWRAPAFGVAGLAVILATGHLASILRAESINSDPVRSFTELRRAAVLAPWRPTPVEKAAAIALESGNPALLPGTARLLETFAWQQPDSAVRAQLTAHAKARLGRPVEAAMLLRQATQQQFRDDRRRREYNDFIETLREASSGVH